MWTSKLLVLVLVLLARLCRAEVIASTPDQATSNLVEDLVTIVTTCYEDRIHGIGLVGDLPDVLFRTLSTQHTIPVVVIGDSKPFDDAPVWAPVQTRYKLPIFIVDVSDVRRFIDTLLMKIDYSIWWNHMASFFIVDRSPRCKMSEKFLYIAWVFNVVNAKVICYSDTVRNDFRAFNPFTSVAPIPWKELNTIPGKYRHPFTVFRRTSRENESLCTNLDFDKVNDCGGHPLMVADRLIDTNEIETTAFRRSSKNYLRTIKRIVSHIYRALNVTPIYLPGQSIASRDLGENPVWLRHSWSTHLVSYPFTQSGFVILSKFRGNKSQLQKILGVIDYNSHIGMGIAYLVTLLFFTFVVRQALVPAVLNLVRITCGMGFDNVPHGNPPRIYLTGILFFAVTMHGIFEGNLASLLTTVIPVRNVNTFKDILDLNYTLYGYSHIANILEPEVIKHYVMVDSFNDCIMKVKDQESSAAICFLEGSTLDFATIWNLHVSQNLVTTAYGVFIIKWSLPYEERFNKILSILVEANVLQPWDIECNPVKLENFQEDQDVKQNKDFKNIELGELTFAFVILGIGLVSASIVFILELGNYYLFCIFTCEATGEWM